MMEKAKKFLKIIQLKNKQRAINKQYERDGLTDSVLMEQIKLNKLRHKLDISDSENIVYENFVQ